jgi:hypothetical protein
MANKVQIKLTPEQREAVRQATGKTADSIEMTVQELEERIAPMTALSEE